MSKRRAHLKAIWQAGVDAVKGEAAVGVQLNEHQISKPDAILAVGKAAASMARAALARFGAETPCLICTKYGHADGTFEGAEVIEASHPVPDQNSLRAGARVLEFVKGMTHDGHLLLLVSGGASALVEHLQDGLTLDDLAAENARLLAAGLDIHAMNRRRKELSQIKGGQLLGAFSGRRATVYAISDVEGDEIGAIGSGIGASPKGGTLDYHLTLVGTNATARAAAAQAATELGYEVLSSEEVLYCDVAKAAQRIDSQLDAAPGVRIWGGEPTVVLPENPGAGGRNQALALLAAKALAGRTDVGLIVGGTDGSDGPTDAAGGMVDGQTWSAEAEAYLARADSGTYLAQIGDLLVTGPTGTNVMDLAVSITDA